MSRYAPVADRIMEKVELSGECWLWTGTVSGGYGHIGAKGRTRLVHRLIYEETIGPIPAGLQIDHLCGVKVCVNPDHLEAVTPSENSRRAPNGGGAHQRAKTHCKHGHEFNDENTHVWRGGRYCRVCDRLRKRKKSGGSGRCVVTGDCRNLDE